MKIATHNGTFHADDVFAIATLKLVDPTSEVVRTRDSHLIQTSDLRVDVGLRNDPTTGDFDHHQVGGAGARANGVRYASFGLVWQQYGAKLAGSAAAAQRVDERLVQTVDAHDNGQNTHTDLFEDMRVYTIDRLLAIMCPTWNEDAAEAALNQAFTEAVALAQRILTREIEVAQSQLQAVEHVRQAIAKATNPKVIILECFYPWRETVVSEAPDAQFMVFPAPEGESWRVQVVPSEIGEFKSRRDLPEAWAGKQAEELAKLTGVADAIFCHTGRFMAAAGSRAGALQLANLALT